MDTKKYVQDFIPAMDPPDMVYKLFKGLDYPENKVLAPSYKRKIDEFEFDREAKEKVRDIPTQPNPRPQSPRRYRLRHPRPDKKTSGTRSTGT